MTSLLQLLRRHFGAMGSSSQSLLICNLVICTILLYFYVQPTSAFDVLAPSRLKVRELPGEEAKRARYYTDPYNADHRLEFVEFCAKQKKLRDKPDLIKENCKRVDKREFHPDDLRMLFSLFMIILYGAFVRTFIKSYSLTIPYTVVLLFSGLILGLFGKYFCYQLHTFTSLSRLKPAVILYTFLPVLIFETAFGISSHVFFRAITQILLTALPGMMICTGLTACVCFVFFANYSWTFTEALFFGSIISATDPVAVVAILKEVGVSESLSVIIDGESLLNDGVAILLYEIIKEHIFEDTPQPPGEQPDEFPDQSLEIRIIIMLVRIGFGGPIFGYIMAKLAIFCLARIFNDAVVEITITLVAAYMTYYVADDIFQCSGVISVVILGITMSSEKTCISPEILEEVTEFWEMCAHLANTVLFFITGVIISERGSRDLQLHDLWYCILLYCSLNLIRFLMLSMLSPVLTRTGYGMSWQNMAVMVWGGLRGAIGICLSLEIYEEPRFCTPGNKLGPKILFQTAGTVVLTLVINGTTTKKLLDVLKLTAVSQGRLDEMEIVVKHIMEQQRKALVILKHDRYLQDANWDYIYHFTQLENPYKTAQIIKKIKLREASSILSLAAIPTGKYTRCPECNSKVLNEPSNDDYRIMTEESRLRVIKAMKISFWSQYEQGIMTEDAVKILVSVADTVTDKELHMIHCDDLRRYWSLKGVIPWIRKRFFLKFGSRGLRDHFIDPPKQRCRYPLWWVATHPWFDPCMTALVLLYLIPTIWEFVLDVETPSNESGMCDLAHYQLRLAFFILSWIFLVLFLVEFFIKLIGRGISDYCCNKWNYIDCFVLIVMIFDMGTSFVPCYSKSSLRTQEVNNLLKGLRMFRLIRCIRLLKFAIPALVLYLNARVNRQLFLGYDIIVGYIQAIDDVLKYLPNMVDNPRVYRKLKASLDNEHMTAVKETALLQKEHPGIAVAVKTRHASRSVLNQMMTSLKDLRMDGLLDEKENELLTVQLEELMKRLWSSPDYIKPSSPEVLLENLIWIYGDQKLKDHIFNSATLVTFQTGEVVVSGGSASTGIYVIVSGMVKMTYEPSDEDAELRSAYGALPIKEIYRDIEIAKAQEDFLSSGTVIGEAGYLLQRNRKATVTCETDDTTAYLIQKTALDEAKRKFNDPIDSFESRVWRAIGIRRSMAYLPTVVPYYDTWAADKLRMHLERTVVPLNFPSDTWEIPSYVLDTVVIEGYVQDDENGDVYVAPMLIPRSCKTLRFIENPVTVNRIMLITDESLSTNPKNTDVDKSVIASYQYRRGYKETIAEKETTGGRLYKLMHFGVRQKKRRKSNFYSVDNAEKNHAERPSKGATKSVIDANAGYVRYASNLPY